MGDRLRWRSDDELVVDGVHFELRPGIDEPFRSTPDRFCLCKAPWAIEELDSLLGRLAPRRMIEVGLKEGGSTALISLLCDPELLVGVELEPEPIAALHALAAERGFDSRLSIHYGVDQADAAELRRIATEELGDEPLDLVIDDASHMLEPSRQTFNALFPLLRPGGLYLLEDWSWAHTALPVWLRKDPLTKMVFELVVACGHSPDAVESAEINRGWVVVCRGEQPLDPGRFSLDELLGERGRALLPGPEAGVELPPPRPGRLRARAAALRRRAGRG